MQDNSLSRQELESWLRDPVTKKIRKKVDEEMGLSYDNWLNGRFATPELSEFERGKILGMLSVFNVEIDEE